MTSTDKLTTGTATVERFALFGPSPLLPGESAESYDELLGRVCAAAKPANVIEEMFVVDIVALQWEILRWRRLKTTLLQPDRKALSRFLYQALDDRHCIDQFVKELARVLDTCEEVEAGTYLEPAQRYADNEKEVVDALNERLRDHGRHIFLIRLSAKLAKAAELAQSYDRQEPGKISEVLAGVGLSFDDFVADVLSSTAKEGRIEMLAVVERLDQLTANAERRRNAALRELERHRAALAEATRQALRQVEDAEFTVVPEQDVPRLDAPSLAPS